MAEYLPKLDTILMVGVGAAFDFHSGRVRQAPRWIQRSGFEWLYRMCTRAAAAGPALSCEQSALPRRASRCSCSAWRKYPLETPPPAA